ncbi:hypothetical protein VMCG_03571 [Cytospora schulzeri]|uniref:Uncharacterized protein n=1 Tax=Cytospora schulzeri TaxID=448051 RepID=A0A423WW32_9PEZI|nr:hypothetical protein VMCG_03571 [Valsa malicola]
MRADWFSHGVRRAEDGIEARHDDEDVAGKLSDFLDALEGAEEHHHHHDYNDDDDDDDDDDAETTVTEILKETITAAAAMPNNTIPVTVTVNGTGATAAAVNSTDLPFSFLTTTVFAQGAGPTQTISLLPDTVTQTVHHGAYREQQQHRCVGYSCVIEHAYDAVVVVIITQFYFPSCFHFTLESALTFGIGTSTTPAAAAGAEIGTSLAANNPAAVTPAPADPTSSSTKVPDIDTSGLTLMTVLSLGSLVQQTVVPADV